jgi:hypothetical protein
MQTFSFYYNKNNKPTFENFESIEHKKNGIIVIKKGYGKYPNKKNIIRIIEKTEYYKCELNLNLIKKFIDYCAETNEIPYVKTFCQPAINYLNQIHNQFMNMIISENCTEDEKKIVRNSASYSSLNYVFNNPDSIPKIKYDYNYKMTHPISLIP